MINNMWTQKEQGEPSSDSIMSGDDGLKLDSKGELSVHQAQGHRIGAGPAWVGIRVIPGKKEK